MLNRDYAEMLQCLMKHSVEHLVVGAYALAGHGLPRSTGDIDIWVRPDPANAAKVYRALADFGAPLDHVSVETFTYPGVVFQIGVAPCRIDLLTKISGDIDFEEAWKDRLDCDLGGIALHVLGIDTLVKNKLAAARPKDLEDVRLLRRRIGKRGKTGQ